MVKLFSLSVSEALSTKILFFRNIYTSKIFSAQQARPRTKYLTSFEVPGLARPWMLSWRSDFGTAGLAEPEQFEMLMQLVLSEGFLSDPDLMATEKVSCVRVPDCFLTEEYEELPELKHQLIPPFSLGYLKGYRRSLSLLTVLAGIRELELEAEVPNNVKARSFRF